MTDVARIAQAIREASLPGWLLVNQFHRDEIADLLLGVPRDRTNSRPWACLVRADGTVVKVVHAIEAGILDHLPGPVRRYVGRAEFSDALAGLLPRGSRIAAQFSSSFPVASYLDHGTALLLAALGVELVSSEDLVVDCLGAFDEAGIASHERAALALHEAVCESWDRFRSAMSAATAVHEADLQGWIAEVLSARGLDAGEPPLVAAGKGSADPHYGLVGRGKTIERGEVVQLDLWAKETGEAGVFADISWVGVADRSPSLEQSRLFEAVVEAREAGISFLERRLAAGATVRGRDVDEAVRATIAARGLLGAVRHRTGHALGRVRVHGFGVNLDSVEFPDARRLREGSCFSIEPGLYLDEFGMRTEVDAAIRAGRLVVSGALRQQQLLTIGGP